MKNTIIIFLIFALSSCQQDKNHIDITRSLSSDDVSESFFSMNDRLINTIRLYESKITFTDTISKGYPNSINSEKVINHYYETFNIIDFKSNKARIEKFYSNNHFNLIEKLIKPYLYENHSQIKELEQIDSLIKLIVVEEDLKYFAGSQIVKNQIIYNHVFQFLLRHKLEEEITDDIISPFIFKDILLENGKRELQLYTVSMTNGDLFVNSVKIDSTKYKQSQILNFYRGLMPIKHIYDPNTVDDSIQIKTFKENRLTGQIVEIKKWYQTLK